LIYGFRVELLETRVKRLELFLLLRLIFRLSELPFFVLDGVDFRDEPHAVGENLWARHPVDFLDHLVTIIEGVAMVGAAVLELREVRVKLEGLRMDLSLLGLKLAIGVLRVFGHVTVRSFATFEVAEHC
jgi:hypothetical protein